VRSTQTPRREYGSQDLATTNHGWGERQDREILIVEENRKHVVEKLREVSAILTLVLPRLRWHGENCPSCGLLKRTSFVEYQTYEAIAGMSEKCVNLANRLDSSSPSRPVQLEFSDDPEVHFGKVKDVD